MGILSSLKTAVFKVGAAITKPAPIIATAITSPISFLKNPKQAVASFTSQPITSQLVKGAIAGATIATVGAGKIPAVAKATTKIIPKTVTGKIATVAAAHVVYGAVTTNPLGTVKKIAQAGTALVDLGTAISTPSLESAKEYITEHPYATAAIAATGIAAIAKTAIPPILAARQTEAIQEQTKAYESQTKTITEYQSSMQPMIIKVEQAPSMQQAAAGISTLAAAVPISEETTKKKATKKKKKTKKKATKKKKKTIKRRKY